MADKEYIERDKVLALQTDLHFDNIEQLKHWKCRHIDPTDVELLHAADVRPVMTARWTEAIVSAHNLYDHLGIMASMHGYVCSCCQDFSVARYNFCPNCGAEMRPEPPKE